MSGEEDARKTALASERVTDFDDAHHSPISPGSSILQFTMKVPGPDEIEPTLSASPSTADPASMSEPHASVHRTHIRPSAASQLRDPDRYQIIGEHGRGGLGRVSRAHDRDLGRDVAIKELISRGVVSEVRFLREALITARLEHPGIVPVHEAGRWPDGTPFYAMKLVAGRPLRDLISERRTIAERIGLLHHVIAVADAIAYAHGRNIIHRDLKPANIIVGDFGETIVIDWGLAKDLSVANDDFTGGPFRGDLSHHDNDLTATGSVLGTPAYMAPEQERGEHVDQRADVFAIGAMLWELCSLHKVPPVERRLRHRMLRGSGIDQDLITIIDKSLAPQAAARYRDAAAIAADLKAFRSGARIAARNYTLFAILGHWTRRHRTIAVSVIAVIALTMSGVGLYVRDVTAARDKAQRDRDRAQLAEASLLLEKDPTAAKQLLYSITQPSPQSALLLSKALENSAVLTIRLPNAATVLLHEPSMASLVVVTSRGSLISVDLNTGITIDIDRSVGGAVTRSSSGWLYSRKSALDGTVTLVDTSKIGQIISVGQRLGDVTSQVLESGGVIYGRDNNDLYEITATGANLIRTDVRQIAGNSHVVMVCTTHNELTVVRDRVIQLNAKCASNQSISPMAAEGEIYAALQDSNTLLLARGGSVRELKLKTQISGEYAIAVSAEGVLALADFGDKAWFVRKGGSEVVLAPAHESHPTSVAASGHYAAWGYADGSVLVLDTDNAQAWEFKGHGSLVSQLVIDSMNNRVISSAGSDLRIWKLKVSSLERVGKLPCKIFNIARSPDGSKMALDGADGWLRVWDMSSGRIAEYHHHANIAFGVAWLDGSACSGGFDGRVLCSSSSGSSLELYSGVESIRWLTASPNGHKLLFGTADGKIVEYEHSVRILYSHKSRPYRMAFSSDGKLVASGATDGSVTIYDQDTRKVFSLEHAHGSIVTNVAWGGYSLWTASADGTIKSWSMSKTEPDVVKRLSEHGTVRLFHLIGTGWTANVDERLLYISRPPESEILRFDLGSRIEHIDTSVNERYVVASTTREIVVVDLNTASLASVSISTDGGGYVGFMGGDMLAISTENEILSLLPSALSFTPINPSQDR